MSYLIPHNPETGKPKTHEELSLGEKQSILTEIETAAAQTASRGIKLGAEAIAYAKKLASEISDATKTTRTADVR